MPSDLAPKNLSVPRGEKRIAERITARLIALLDNDP